MHSSRFCVAPLAGRMSKSPAASAVPAARPTSGCAVGLRACHRSPVLTLRMIVSASAPATRCPAMTSCMILPVGNLGPRTSFSVGLNDKGPPPKPRYILPESFF
eukprot:3229912-Rhodomonas_salina.1